MYASLNKVHVIKANTPCSFSSRDRRLYVPKKLLCLLNIWRTLVLLSGHWYPCHGDMCVSKPVDPSPVHDGFQRFTSGVTPANLMTKNNLHLIFRSSNKGIFSCRLTHATASVHTLSKNKCRIRSSCGPCARRKGWSQQIYWSCG